MNSRGAVPLTRAIMPKAGPESYKSYSWRQPLNTHFRKVTCEEARCKQFTRGWVTMVDTATELGQRQYHYLTHDTSRKYTLDQIGTMASFTYPPGQQPFAGPAHEHRKPIGYDPIMLVHGGDFRGNPRRTPPVVMKAADFVDDFATHLDRLARAQS
jgi:hypothetical protein